MPGYRTVRRRAVPWIRNSATARALAYRLFAMESRRSAALVEPPLELSAGRLLGGVGTDRLPVILLSLVGLADGDGRNRPIGDVVDGVIDDVAEMQLLGAGFRPVFLLDTPAFSRARSYGYVGRARHTPRSLVGRTGGLVGLCRCSDCIDENQLRGLDGDHHRSGWAR